MHILHLFTYSLVVTLSTFSFVHGPHKNWGLLNLFRCFFFVLHSQLLTNILCSHSLFLVSLWLQFSQVKTCDHLIGTTSCNFYLPGSPLLRIKLPVSLLIINIFCNNFSSAYTCQSLLVSSIDLHKVHKSQWY